MICIYATHDGCQDYIVLPVVVVQEVIKYIPYFTVEAPMSNKHPAPIFGEKSCVRLIAPQTSAHCQLLVQRLD